MVVLAAMCALVLPPAAWVEHAYSNGIFRWIQPALTGVSNHAPFGLIDIVVIGVGVWAVIGVVRAIRQPRRHALPFMRDLVVLTAGLMVWFFLVWGFNMRRLPLRATVPFDPTAVTHANLIALANRAVRELNALAPRLPAVWPSHQAMDSALAPAFAMAETALGVPWRSVPARPKSSLLSPYLRAIGFNGMSVPFFGEAYLNGSLLNFERPYVVAHEWAHVAGRGNEHEAAFIGWLACMYGPEWAQYSAWMRLYAYAVDELSPAEQAMLRETLNRKTRRHFAESFLRSVRGRVRAVAAVERATRRTLNRSVRVEKSALDYGLVLHLVLGVQLPRLSSSSPPETNSFRPAWHHVGSMPRSATFHPD